MSDSIVFIFRFLLWSSELIFVVVGVVVDRLVFFLFYSRNFWDQIVYVLNNQSISTRFVSK